MAEEVPVARAGVVSRATDLREGGGDPWTLQVKAVGPPSSTERMLPMKSPSLRLGPTLASGTGCVWGVEGLM